ncbi:MAG: zinc-binding dehydrogenase [Bdellovibrionota bacterium]
MLKIHACGVCGTDIVKYQYDMVKPPIVLGHEVAGTIEKIGKNVTKFKAGDRVVVAHRAMLFLPLLQTWKRVYVRCLQKSNLDPGSFAEYLRIPAPHVQMTAHKIPEGMTFEEAIFMEPLACILRNIKRAGLHQKDSALIVGLGSVGLMTGMALKSMGIKVFATDLKQERIDLAMKLGLDWATVPTAALKDEIHARTNPHGVDLVVLTAGNEKVYSDSVNYVRDGGAVSIFAGMGPESKLEFNINNLYKREIVVYASYSPSPIELMEALQMIQNGEVNVKALAPKKFSLDQVEQAILAVQKQQVYKAIIQPNM